MNSGDNYIGEHATSKVQDVSKEERRVILQHTSRFETCLQVAAFHRPERRLESDSFVSAPMRENLFLRPLECVKKSETKLSYFLL